MMSSEEGNISRFMYCVNHLQLNHPDKENDTFPCLHCLILILDCSDIAMASTTRFILMKSGSLFHKKRFSHSREGRGF